MELRPLSDSAHRAIDDQRESRLAAQRELRGCPLLAGPAAVASCLNELAGQRSVFPA